MTIERDEVDEAIGCYRKIRDETVVAAILCERSRSWIIEEEALPLSAYPNKTILCTRHLVYGGTDQNTITGCLIKARERIVKATIDIQPEGAAEPDITILLEQSCNLIVLESHIFSNHIAIDDISLPVVTIEAVGGTEPKETITILQTTEDTIVREAINGHITFETIGG